MTSDFYDAVSFESLANPERSIDRLYSLARLRGLSPVAPHEATLVEFGCSTGSLLIAHALQYPSLRCIGLDLSSQQISQAKECADALGLKNIEFLVADITDCSLRHIRADYIVSHGLFSWVPNATRQALLAQCAEVISPSGVGYLSFATPYAHRFSQQIRTYILGKISSIVVPEQRIAAARRLLRACCEMLADRDNCINSRVSQELRYLSAASDSLLLHDFLNVDTKSFFVRDIAQYLRAANLRYVADSRIQRQAHGSEPFKEQVSELSEDRAYHDDWFDLRHPKSFRAALFCGSNQSTATDSLNTRLEGLHGASPLVFDGEESGVWRYMGGEEHAVYIKNRLVHELLQEFMSRWPQPKIFTREMLAELTVEEMSEISSLIAAGHIELSYGDFNCSTSVTQHPMVSPLSRQQAKTSPLLSTLKHEVYYCNLFEQIVARYADGTRTVEQLLRDVQAELRESAGEVSNDFLSDAYLRSALNEALNNFKEHALLIRASGRHEEPLKVTTA
jgi:ubiquinone/menaquinone biosynthesis C-methylase UbiE